MISIIIPLYNKEKTIQKSIESVLMQNYEDYEIIIVDDGSTDKSVEVVESLQSDKIHLYRKQNGGPSSARNYGVQKAKGNWLLFLDADDELLPGALALAAKNIREHKKEDVFTYNMLVFGNEVTYLRIKNHCQGRMRFPYYRWYKEQCYPRTGTMVVRKECMLKHPYREDLRRWEDIENTFNLMRNYNFYADSTPILQYNVDYVDASLPRKNPQEDFVTQMDPHGKSWDERLALRYLYFKDTCWMYPQSITPEMRQRFEGWRIRVLSKMVNLIEGII